MPTEYEVIRKMVSEKRYDQAISQYYKNFKEKIVKNDVFSNELIYLKREASVQIAGLELVALYGIPKSRKIVSRNLKKFIEIVDKKIKLRGDKGLPTPLDVLNDQLPTVKDMLQQRSNERRSSVYFADGKITRDNSVVTEESFSVKYDKCLKGNIFKIFPDPVRQSEIIDIIESTKYWHLR